MIEIGALEDNVNLTIVELKGEGNKRTERAGTYVIRTIMELKHRNGASILFVYQKIIRTIVELKRMPVDGLRRVLIN